MATYLLFAGHEYYPEGGMDDLIGVYATEAEARVAFDPDGYSWAHIAEVGDGLLARRVAVYRHYNYSEWTHDEERSAAFPYGRLVPHPQAQFIPAAWVADE